MAAAAAAALWAAGCAPAPVRRDEGRRARPSAAQAPPLAKAVVRTAKSYLPDEESGRAQPEDCSDFTQKVFAENGVKLARGAADQSLQGARIASSRDLRMGDLVFFSGSKINRIVGHVGIYVNNGIFIHFPNKDTGVTMESMFSDNYRKRYLSARRIIP